MLKDDVKALARGPAPVEGHDGADLLQVNGHIEPEIARVQNGQTYLQSTQLFRGTGHEPIFLEVPSEEIGALSRPIVGRAAATADLDRDGDPDLVISHLDSAPLVLRNDLVLPTGASSCTIHVVGPPDNPHGIGVMVTLRMNGVFSRQVVTRTRSYLGQSTASLVFPVTAGTKMINQISVKFGKDEELVLQNIPLQEEIFVPLPF